MKWWWKRRAAGVERFSPAAGELLEARRQVRDLASQLILAEEQERRRIARGLHHVVGNGLTLARMRIGQLQATEPVEERRRVLAEVSELLAVAIEETRSLTFDLSSLVLSELGFEPALQSLGERIAEISGLEITFESDGRSKPLPEEAQVILYRVVEELLVNVMKHARARAARIAVASAGDAVRIVVEDDGVGLDRHGPGAAAGAPAGGTRGLGLLGVRQRLEHLGGRLAIDSPPSPVDRGTRVSVVVPLELDLGGSR